MKKGRPLVSIIYGYHGLAPLHLEDLFNYLQGILDLGGCDLEYVHSVGNAEADGFIFLDGFEPSHVEDMKVLKSKGKVVTIVGTEHLTANTFNKFQEETSFSTSLFRWSSVLSALNRHPTAVSDRDLKKRFDAFSMGCDVADQVWVLGGQTSISSYRELFGSKVVQIPIGYTAAIDFSETYSSCQKTADFFFSGTITPHRKAVLEALQNAGRTVEILPVTTPNFIRLNRAAHARAVLALRQNETWQIPSLLRHLYHLSNGHLVIREGTLVRDPLDQYLAVGPDKGRVEFVEFARDLVAREETATLARLNSEAFKRELRISSEVGSEFANIFHDRAAG
jgi:hypothetical protein